MEEYLENLKSLRSYMNDVEDEAAKQSAEEQSQKTAIGYLDIDLKLVKSEIKKVNEETLEMIKEKRKLEMEISEKQKKIISLDIECTTLKQTLELLHQEIDVNSEKLNSKRSFYANTSENFSTGLKDHQEWIHKNKQSRRDDQLDGIKTDEKEGLKSRLKFVKNKMEELETKRSALRAETLKNKELVEQEMRKIEALPIALREMEFTALETEYESLVSDKSGELGFVQSLQDRINALTEFHYGVECQCGVKYKVEIVREALAHWYYNAPPNSNARDRIPPLPIFLSGAVHRIRL